MKCAFVVFLVCLLSVSSWGQESSPGSVSGSYPASDEIPLPLSQQLRDLATTLEQATTDSASDWELWSQEWTGHLKTLEDLANLSTESELEMQSMKASLVNYERSLTNSIRREAAARRHEEVWRVVGIGGLTAAALFAAVLAAGK
jgi:hypothetical protein